MLGDSVRTFSWNCRTEEYKNVTAYDALALLPGCGMSGLTAVQREAVRYGIDRCLFTQSDVDSALERYKDREAAMKKIEATPLIELLPRSARLGYLKFERAWNRLTKKEQREAIDLYNTVSLKVEAKQRGDWKGAARLERQLGRDWA